MDYKIKIFNPFILGTQLNSVYSNQRKASHPSNDGNCCLDLPWTYELQLVIHPRHWEKIPIISRNKRNEYHSLTLLAYFPSVTLRNLKFTYDYSVDTSKVSLDIWGYDFGKLIDNVPIDKKIQKFKKSQLLFDNVDINTDVNGQFNINSTFY